MDFAESLSINKFDLSIDWGMVLNFLKPLFFLLDYLFKMWKFWFSN